MSSADKVPVRKQIFLGGACGVTTWRQKIAIPALESAGVTYYDPQLGIGEWTEACEKAEMQSKTDAEVLLFVINGETRGVASVGEVAYYLAAGRRLALVVTDVGQDDAIDGRVLSPAERDDLNRGRIFLRTMARRHEIPVHASVYEAVRYAIGIVNTNDGVLNRERLQAILADVQFKTTKFLVEEI